MAEEEGETSEKSIGEISSQNIMEYEEFEQQSPPQVEEFKSSTDAKRQNKPDQTTRPVPESPPTAAQD